MSEEEQIMQAWDLGDFQKMIDNLWKEARKQSHRNPKNVHRLRYFETSVEVRMTRRYKYERNRDYSVGIWTTDNGEHVVCEFVFDFDLGETVYRHVTGMENVSSIHAYWFNNGRGILIP